MAESMLAILCHILRGEPVIQERLAKEREGTARPEEEGPPAGPVVAVGAPGAPVVVGEGPPGPGPAAGGPPPPAAPPPAAAAAGGGGGGGGGSGGGGGGGGGGGADDSTNSTPRRDPQVNQPQLTQVRGDRKSVV